MTIGDDGIATRDNNKHSLELLPQTWEQQVIEKAEDIYSSRHIILEDYAAFYAKIIHLGLILKGRHSLND